jgi:hypothetical protein
MRFLLLSVLLIFFINNIKAQQSTIELGGEIAYTRAYYKVNDAGGNIAKQPSSGLLYGLSARYGLKNNFYLHTGLQLHHYTENLRLKQELGFRYSNFIDALHIPVRLGYKIHMSKKDRNFFLTTHAGIVPSFILVSADGDSIAYNNTDGNGNPLIFNYTYRALNKNFFVLANVGAGLQINILKKLHANFSIQSFIGTSNIAIADATYKIGNQPTQNATIYHKGSFLAYNVGIHYRL